jgi:hypothetical protein
MEEIDTAFPIDWKSLWYIDGPKFDYADRDSGRVVAVPGTHGRQIR